MSPSLARSYVVLTTLLSAYFVALWWVVTRGSSASVDPAALVRPVIALVALTAVVWILMFVFRNLTVIRGRVSVDYYKAFRGPEAPDDWVERPARTFMNLLETPVLFYVGCVLMLVMHRCDAAQLQLAWIFVGVRALHAIIYIGFNHVPSRLGAYVASCVALAVMWFRFSAQVL